MYISNIPMYLRAIPVSLFFNFWYFPFKMAIKLPILISHRMWFKKLSGTVIVHNPTFLGIKIGFGECDLYDQHRRRGVWRLSGTMEFDTWSIIGHGTKFDVEGHVKFGIGSRIKAETDIVCKKSITIGKYVEMAWGILLMDTDYHNIRDEQGAILNPIKPITIGDHVWVGCKNVILKGSHIPSGCIVGANSTINKSFTEENAIIAGNPAKVVKTKITWE